MKQCLLYMVIVSKGRQHFKIVSSIEVQSCFIVVNDMKVHSPAQLALGILDDLLYEVASHAKVPVLFCHAKRQNIDDFLLV